MTLLFPILAVNEVCRALARHYSLRLPELRHVKAFWTTRSSKKKLRRWDVDSVKEQPLKVDKRELIKILVERGYNQSGSLAPDRLHAPKARMTDVAGMDSIKTGQWLK